MLKISRDAQYIACILYGCEMSEGIDIWEASGIELVFPPAFFFESLRWLNPPVWEDVMVGDDRNLVGAYHTLYTLVFNK